MSVVSMAVGATAATGATFAVRVDAGGPMQVAVADNVGMADAVFFGPVGVDARGVAKVSATGLNPSTRYWWQAFDDGDGSVSAAGQFRTHPPLGQQASFTCAVSGCAGLDPAFPGAGTELVPDAVSNAPIFDVIRQRALAEDWLSFVHLGDLHYYNLGGSGAPSGTLTNYRRSYDDVLEQPRQHQLYRELAWSYVWDDHDYGPNNSDGTLPGKGNAALAYRERVPHHDLPAGSGQAPIYQSWQVGRVLFIASDVRYNRSPNQSPDNASKTMLGAAQKAWMDNLLATTQAEFLVWLMPSQWLGDGIDTWAAFTRERDELVQMLSGRGWLNRMCMVYGDRHAVGIDSGAGNPWGGFPVLQAAGLDSSYGDPVADRFDVLADSPGRSQYGTVEISDRGSYMVVTLAAWQDDEQLGSYTFARQIGVPPPTPGALLRTIAGSHFMRVEARVLDTFQVGDDPVGTEIPIHDGDVTFDGTADVWGTLDLVTDGNGMWPRRGSELLAPFGNEVFVRRGVDLGAGGVLWIPLGYYRIDAAEQDDTPDGMIRLSGSDRMAGIVDGRLLEPREFKAHRTIGSVVTELVGEIYPGFVVTYDDDTDERRLGRLWVAEESRYGALRDIVEAAGKIVYWDDQGVLRIESAPSDDDIVWDIRAGKRDRNGTDAVLLNARRRLSREGVYNAVVAYGEGQDDQTSPTRAVAMDIGPNSPTRWGGRFGRVPRFYSSPLITTTAQAVSAAQAMLRRSIGFPRNLDLSTVPNPALRPYQVVRVDTGDTRERHAIQRVTIPLSTQAQTATTREKTQVAIEVTS